MESVTAEEDEGGRSRRCHVNRQFIPLKMIYFFFMAGESCALLYRSIFMRHLGMSAKQTGVIWTLERVVSVVLPPFIGAVTDKTRRPKLVLMVLLIGGGLVVFSMYFIPQEQYVPASGLNSSFSSEDLKNGNSSFCSEISCNSTWDEEQHCEIGEARADGLDCHSEAIVITTVACRSTSPNQATVSSFKRDGENMSKLVNNISECTFVPSKNDSNTLLTFKLPSSYSEYLYFTLSKGVMYVVNEDNGKLLCVDYGDITNCDEWIPNPTDEYGVTFWLLTALIFLATFTTIGSYPVLEASVLGILGPSKRHKFGQQRLWASVGFGIAALVVGFLKDQATGSVGPAGNPNRAFLPMYVGVLICWTCAAIVASKLPIRAAKKSAGIRLKDIKQVLKRPKAAAFFALLLFYGADNAVQEIFVFWLAEVKLNAPSSILGAATFTGAFLDIPFCLMSGRLVKKFGHAPCLCFGMLAFSLRLILYTVITQPWQLICVESLRCITWGLTYVTICSYTAKLSPKGLEASTMGLTQGINWGVGYSAGALLGGVLFESIGADYTFLAFGLATVVAVVIFGTFSFLIRNTAKSKDKEEDLKSMKFIIPEEETTNMTATT